MSKDLNFNQICGKLIKDAREEKGISVEDLALYLLPKKEEAVIGENHNLDEYKGTLLEKKVEDSQLRKQIFKDAEMEKLYQENIKKINYWEKGNGFPDLDEIWKLAEYIDIDPNEVYKYRELGRKNLKGEQSMSKWKFYRNRFIEDNLESLRTLFPALVMLFVIWFILTGADTIREIFTFFELFFAGNS